MLLLLLGLAWGFSPEVRRVETRLLRATVDDAEYTRQQLAARQASYEAARRQAAQTHTLDVPALDSLPFIEVIQDGCVATLGATPRTRASVYAIYDAEKRLAHVGKSRDARQSLRIVLARQPDLCHFVRVYHVEKPSRTFLDVVVAAWAASQPLGNDGAEGQRAWEAALDVKPFMTEEDCRDLEEKKTRGKEALAYKAVARRYEQQKLQALQARGLDVKSFVFDPKLKGQGLLDLKPATAPDDSVPSK
ncbi:hypothetical protein CTAYLR_000693 [Chrysophaeum taylorii]|uniref:GIY-YIG nuclease family protein n=1 Tax=Chrysophaeum taylorii TaxID=2483200 RepID=A0AAD7U8S4_9STRA|nr:hypothetical protein CTAYLR_000693 [Chrysophaeum taylorii]